MDAGTAAVLGALAGSVATIGAALATGWAQREGARITARSEHRSQRREPRQAIYREFIAVGSLMRNHTSPYSLGEEYIPNELDEDHRNRIFEAAQVLKNKAFDVALSGPEQVTKVAIRIEHLSWELAAILGALEQLNIPGNEQQRQRIRAHVARTAGDLGKELDSFVLAAQKALDDDGTRR
ncbi:hypothetical protein AB0I69_05500 [Streptomyces sp. NPDC050508]|uniref:hypothetical protein n=1 Tax=Streptomyces sp. NPDC050508 TaxID=3155405 RepID=UPI0034405B4A